LALGVHNGGYIAEIFRGAIQSIDRGQKEAALSLGMTEWQTMHRIVLPQAFKRANSPLGNQFIIALKDSSLASTIAVKELLLRTRQVGSSQFMMMEILIIGASGSGKSTLLRCINFLESIRSGKIIIDGELLERKSKTIHKVRQEVGMVFQHFNLFPHRTVLGNIIEGHQHLRWIQNW
jgi:ABC-type glutathione transport system ATPase component